MALVFDLMTTNFEKNGSSVKYKAPDQSEIVRVPGA